MIELRTGISREPQREDMCNRIGGCSMDKDMPTPLWNAFLSRVLPDSPTRAYLKRVCGYCLTGSTDEHVMFFLYGTGRNGKGVFLNTLRGIWNDYAMTAPLGMLMEHKQERHETELAQLDGVRLVICQEIERNQRWAESRIKALTGGDRIRARFMRQDYFEFDPRFKLVIAGNHKPSLRGVDEAIKARIHLIPFTVTIPSGERDKQLKDKLRAEWPGILAWAVEGCLEYQKFGLAPPKAVLDTTAEYLRDQDTLRQWIEECCNPGGEEMLAKLYASWKDWTGANGLPTGSSRSLRQALTERGYERHHTNKGTNISGLHLRLDSETPSW
jgi:putative DNA primase/helicase